REPGGESSAAVRARVRTARQLQIDRQGTLNAGLRAPQLRRWAPLDATALSALRRWAGQRGLSARGFHPAWRVARTIADLDTGGAVRAHHVIEAPGDRPVPPAA